MYFIPRISIRLSSAFAFRYLIEISYSGFDSIFMWMKFIFFVFNFRIIWTKFPSVLFLYIHFRTLSEWNFFYSVFELSEGNFFFWVLSRYFWVWVEFERRACRASVREDGPLSTYFSRYTTCRTAMSRWRTPPHLTLHIQHSSNFSTFWCLTISQRLFLFYSQ